MKKLRPTGKKYGSRIWPASSGYDLAADSYEQWYWHSFWEANETPLVRAEIERYGSARAAIDVGTGTGRYLRVLSECGIRTAVGMDVSREMLMRAHARVPGASCVVGSIDAAPFRDGAFDIAVVCRVLSHVSSPEIAFAELGRITRPGGVAVFSDVAAGHGYEATRIPIGDRGDVYIETYKYSKERVVSAAQASGCWSVECLREFAFRDLLSKSVAEQYPTIDSSSVRPVFTFGVLRRSGAV